MDGNLTGERAKRSAEDIQTIEDRMDTKGIPKIMYVIKNTFNKKYLGPDGSFVEKVDEARIFSSFMVATGMLNANEEVQTIGTVPSGGIKEKPK